MSQIVIDYLHHSSLDVIVVDMHYARMKELEERLSKANAYASSAFFDWVIDLKQLRFAAHYLLLVGTWWPVSVDGLGIAPNISSITYLALVDPDPPVSRLDYLAELLSRASLIIWDEAPMAHRHCFEAYLAWRGFQAGPSRRSEIIKASLLSSR
jgi:hypothetical protein